ncbi:MAG TPA: LCP family protein [Spirillospora sp.]|nr:LCP family protein [Spirillospora sp.]
MRIPGWLFIVGIVAAIGTTGLCSVVSFLAARQVALDTAAAGIQGGSFRDILPGQPTTMPTSVAAAATPEPTSTAAASQADTAAGTPISVEPTPTLDPLADYRWDDPRQVRILLLGIDQRTGVEDDEKYFRTDTMMVVNIDPVRETIGVLSIPRDLWVDIPDGGPPARINTANARGDSNGYPGGGPALAMQTVQNNLGLRVDHFLLVNFDVFTTAVDLLAPDGVEICVRELIDDPNYPDAGYGTIHVRFETGCQMLDAERLLQYARTRATQGADFDRARRQQEVLKAMQQKLVSLEGVGNLIVQAPALWDELSDSFKTNLTLQEIIGLGTLVQRIPRENIRFGVIDNLYVTFGVTAAGDQVLFPNYNAIRQLIQQVFNPPDADMSTADLRSRALAEGATIAVFNNTDVAGLAGQTRDWLASKGVSVEQVGNTAEITNGDTVIRDYGGNHIWTARYLAALMGLSSDRIQPGADGLMAQGVAVIAGTDVQSILAGG